jgi:diguanylate cyclase (GGDEF)-like protein
MRNLPIKAYLYITSMILVGSALTLWHLSRLDWGNKGLLLLAGLAATSQILKVEGTTERSSYNLSWLLYGFTFLLFGPTETMFVILIGHLAEWVWYRYPWQIQIFNISAYALTISATFLIHQSINSIRLPFSLQQIVALLVALAYFTFINHTAIGLVIWLARGQSIKQSGVFEILPLMIDFTLLVLGVTSGLLWTYYPIAAILPITPLYLIYSTLKLPSLQRQSEIDPKTKLYNAEYFKEVFDKELLRANRFNRPLTVVLGDLDLLRNINNTYGHLAGDVVLCRIADILKTKFRDFDTVARFGGEEFAILLPETTPEQAFQRVEIIRETIESTRFDVSTSVIPITATMSFGISGREGYEQSSIDIIHNADVALYSAKLDGRNETRIYQDKGITSLFGIDSDAHSIHEPRPIKSRLKKHHITYKPSPK